MASPASNPVFQFPPVALGCMSLPERYADAAKVVHAACDQGISLFDTADLYQNGTNESNLGSALEGRRQHVLLATKVGNQRNPDGTSWTWNPRKAYILQEVEESLRRLRTPYIDLYQLHGGTMEDPWEETLEAFELLIQQGKIRAFGISSIRPTVIRHVLRLLPPASVMMQYSPLDRRPEETVFPLLEKTSTRVVVRGAFAKGMLINKPVSGFLDFPAEKVREIKSEIMQLGYSPEAVLIRFGLIEKAVATLVIGASSVDQISRLSAGYEASKAVPDDLIQLLKRKLPVNHYLEHQ